MNITEVNIELARDEGRVLAYGRLTFDHQFMVRELKIIQARSGIFVAMPDRKLMDRCAGCGKRNVLDAVFCNWCGRGLGKTLPPTTRLHTDVAHPVTPEAREQIELEVISAFQREAARCRSFK